MNILYVITKSELGGAQVHVRQLLADMVQKGHSVSLMSSPSGWLEEEALKLGVVVFPNSYFANTINPVRLFRAAKRVHSVVQTLQPDSISCHSSFAGFLTRVVVRGNIPTIFTAHSWAFTEGASAGRRLLARMAERIVSRYAKKIICVSRYDRELAVRYDIAPAEKLITIHNGVALEELPIKKEQGVVEIVSIGRLAYPKEYELLIESFAALPKMLQEQSRLRIVGGGPLHGALEKTIRRLGMETYIHLEREQRPEKVKELLHTADIFILLSKHEGFPMTILEAMSAGVPVIASRVGGIPEICTEGAGITVPNEESAITGALKELIGSPSKRMQMGAIARKQIEESFSEELFLQKTQAVYQAVLNEKKKIF